VGGTGSASGRRSHSRGNHSQGSHSRADATEGSVSSSPGLDLTGTDLEFKNNYFTEMCSGSEAGSYLRLIDFVYHWGLRGLRRGGAATLARTPPRAPSRPPRGSTSQVQILSHTMYQLNGFRKSTPPQNRQLIVYSVKIHNKLTILWVCVGAAQPLSRGRYRGLLLVLPRPGPHRY